VEGLTKSAIQMRLADLEPDKGKIGKTDIELGLGMVAQVMRGQFGVAVLAVAQERSAADQA